MPNRLLFQATTEGRFGRRIVTAIEVHVATTTGAHTLLLRAVRVILVITVSVSPVIIVGFLGTMLATTHTWVRWSAEVQP